MLQINNLTYRIEGRPLLVQANATVPTGHKVGLVGRNGTGKTTLLRLITGDIQPDDGEISWPKAARLGYVEQEAPGGDDTLIEWVLAADKERAALLSEAETTREPERIADIQLRLNDIDAHSAPARAAQLLAGLGFDEAAQQRPCRSYSGGWRMRVALAAVLFLEPELLLLDEPTNYLDLEGTMWLENYIRYYPHTVIMVSHDRDLLNRAVNAILHLDQGRLTLYSGGYDAFEDTRRERQRLQSKLKHKQDQERERIEKFINRFKAQANKAKQAQSRIKALARMKPIAADADGAVAPISFPDPAKVLASPLVQIERGAVGYTPGSPVLTNLDLRIDNDDRIALLGQNGNGKSTFAKLLAGKIELETGEMRAHKQLKVGYFAQHQLDELAAGRTPYDYIARLLPDATEAQKRARLGAFGFGIEKADTSCAKLSGGEKARLMLMLTAFHGPHIIILDEPTNHLDVDSREMLIQALNDYQGAVILISHDRHLIDASADRLWIVEGGTVTAYDDDMDAYRERMLAARAGRKRAQVPEETSQPSGSKDDSGESRAEQRRKAAEQRALLAPLRKLMQQAEQAVEKTQAKIARLDATLADPEIYTRETAKAQQLMRERGSLAKELEELETNWLQAADAYETASAQSG
ncbi:MAG: ABC-F family ATP-binding cassette domain-containing protein [Alphaproteobacteria bacterium]|nr:ABC-F family ATP-binding cassette domain-containing protein [Alphaproteobacteria bacterium]